jgi:ABC-type oligopeptide transport system ATPase subunit
MWSDNEAKSDLLGYHHLIDAVESVLTNDSLLPATIGVFGDWGSGKSTLVRMVCEAFADDKGTLVVSFNGWLFESYEDAKLALMGTIIDEITDKKKITVRGKELILGLVARINYWKVASVAARAAAGYAAAGAPGLLAGTLPDIGSATKALLESAKEVEPEKLGEFLREKDSGHQSRRSVREFRDDFAELLADTKLKRLVVVVDDLDRCSPDRIIETLEAIKLFLFVPGTAFVIGADERLIKYAVRRRFPELPGERAEVGRDYLEKLIQFPVRIPPMGPSETETYIKLLLSENCLSKEDHERVRAAVISSDMAIDARLDKALLEKALGRKTDPSIDEALGLADQISRVLATGLAGNPRQCKRFLNTLVMRLGMARSRKIELKRAVLAKIMLLEYLRPESFKELARIQDLQEGHPKALAALEANAGEAAVHAKPSASGSSRTKESMPATKSPSADASAADKDPAGLAAWQDDEWLRTWLKSEPRLADEDLRPYFYFSREKLNPLVNLGLRMSPQAQTALAKLLGPSMAERSSAISGAAQLSQADAAAVFEALTQHIREADAIEGTSSSPLMQLFTWVEARPELFAEFATFLRSLREGAIPFSIAPRLAALASSPERKSTVKAILAQWSEQGDAKMKQAATTALAKITQ